MEVIVSAAVLILIVLGVLAAIDSVSRTAAANQGRTVAATLAEKDLERLRALRTSDLNRLDEIEIETKTVMVGNISWDVTSKAEWVTDSDGEQISCALTGERGSYLRITSSVVATNAPPDARPLVMSSIVAPQPGKGTLTALVRDHAGAPVVGLPVQAIGPSPDTQPTNAAGCAVFDEAEAGSYKLRLDYSGWVDPDGFRLVEKSGTVSAGNLTTVEFIYDRAGSFPVSVVTRRPGEAVDRADRSNGLIAAHTGVSTGYRAVTSAGTGATSFTFSSMFPFSTPYEVYSGICTGNNPSTTPVGEIPDYFSTHPLAVAQVNPGVAGTARVVLEPAIDVTVRFKNGSAAFATVSGARVYVYPKTADCAPEARVQLGTTRDPLREDPREHRCGPGHAVRRLRRLRPVHVLLDDPAGLLEQHHQHQPGRHGARGGHPVDRRRGELPDMSRLRAEDGFTVMELITAMAVGFVLLAATLGLLESSVRLNTGVISKTDAMQRGRLAMDTVTQQLRSQVCLDWDNSAVRADADDESVTFFADYGEGAASSPSCGRCTTTRRRAGSSSTAPTRRRRSRTRSSRTATPTRPTRSTWSSRTPSWSGTP